MLTHIDPIWLQQHSQRLCESYQRLCARPLLPKPDEDVASALWHAPFVVLSHGTQADPIFNYANQAGLNLFDYEWAQWLALPSRLSAEPGEQTARDQLLQTVYQQGYSDNYTGIRIGRSGERFLIEAATVWNVVDDKGVFHGQAAYLPQWTRL